MNGEQPILAGLAVRILIEMICKNQSAGGKNLFAKIDDLKSKGVLTTSGAEILHKLRSMGNDSAHEAKLTLPLKNVSLARCLNSRKDTT
ncbi:DUF4145 domain-containing protein [Pseudomonas syringae pv. actinidiae str. Shaanxi_M228]|nr:DUF4145 domain-containing protein [Pseudomonas syringae pv. actinidiae str. Shaanxi_M228]